MGAWLIVAPHYRRPAAGPAIVRLAAGWLAGGLLALSLPDNTPLVFAATSLAAGVIALGARRALTAGCLLGLAVTLWAVRVGLEDRLEPTASGGHVSVVGVVDDLPRQEVRRRVLTLRVDTPADLPARVRLAWYEPGEAPMPRVGERWRFNARLKRPRGLANPGGMDWPGWLLRARIGATGYVSGTGGGVRLDGGEDGWLVMRGALAERIRTAAGEGPAGAVLVALVTGFRGLPVPLRDTLARTGTGHLLAISGLHVGLAAALGGFAAGRLARRFAARRPAIDAGSAGALAAGAGYASVAGWPVSARRAVIMLAAALFCLVTRRRPGAAAFALALLAVLMADPLALLDPGLWMSFGAVAVIGWVLAGRVGAPPGIRALFRLQGALSLAMVCLSAPWFGQVSLVSPLANLLAVPWFSLLVVPAALAGAVVINVSAAAGEALLRLAARATELALPVLEGLGGLEWAALGVPETPGWAAACAAAGVAWLSLPRPAPSRWLGACLLAPVLIGDGAVPAAGEFEVLVLDVGQGSAAVVRTAGHTVLFDAGPRWPGGDAGRSTVVPALRGLGVKRLDVMVLSHGDSDHAGGGASVAAGLPVAVTYAGEGAAEQADARCRRGVGWVADGVSFRFLAPAAQFTASRNDGSCVLQVSGPGGRVLFTGDIEARGEAALLAAGPSLSSDLVLAPHHGSRSSSGERLVRATRPAWVVFAAGWQNRWGFPHRDVVRRWQRAGTWALGTDRSGALRFRFSRGGPLPPQSWRHRTCRAWRDCGAVAGP